MPATEPVCIDVADLTLTDCVTGRQAALGDLRDVNVLVILRHRH